MGSEVRLGDFVTLTRGTTYKSALLDEPGPVLLGLASIARDGGFRQDSLRTYGGDSPDKLILRPGDLYVSLKDVTQSGDLLGSVARVPESVARGRLTQDTVKLEFGGDYGWRSYVYWALRAPEYRAYCRARATGTTNLSLSRADFLDFELPPLTDERAALVAGLEALDDKIELNRRMSRTLDEMAQAVFTSWFVDAVRESWPSGGAEPSHGWSASRLGDHVESTRGLSYSSANLAGPGDGAPMHNLNSIDAASGYQLSGLKWFRGEHKARNVARPGDLLLANVDVTQNLAVIGSPALVPSYMGEASLFSADLFRVRPKSKSPLTSTYLYMLLRDPQFHRVVAGYSNGTTVNHLSPDALAMPSIIVPPADLIAEYDRVAAPMLHRREGLELESEALGDLRDALLPPLVTGGIRVEEGPAAGVSLRC